MTREYSVVAGLMMLLGSWASPTVTYSQVVQLPTWRVFAVDTSVLVPDQGTALLGGVNYGHQAAVTRRGLPGPVSSVARHASAGTAQVSVKATIIDHSEWDAALRARAQAKRGLQGERDPVIEQAKWLTQQIRATSQDDEGRVSIEHLEHQSRQLATQQQLQQNQQACEMLRHGDVCRSRRQYSTARMFYRTAWRQSQGTLREEAAAKLANLRGAQARLAPTTRE